MEGLSPVNGGNSSVSDNSSPSSSSSSNTDMTAHDTLQTSRTSNSHAPLSLLSFMNLIGSTSNDLQETLKLSTQSTLSSRIPFYLANTNNTAAEKYTAFLFYYAQATVIVDGNSNSLNSLTSSLGDFNSNVAADLSAVNTMNQAITDFQNGTINQTTYNAAVATYNAYAVSQATRVSDANTAINTFNSAANTNNSFIDSLNHNIPTSGIPLTHQSTYATKSSLPTIASSPPAPTTTINFTESSLTPSNTVTPTTLTLSLLLFTASSTFIADVANDALLMTMLKNADKYFAYQIFFLAGKQLNLPAAYTLPANKISVTDPGTAGGSGSSVALATVASPLNNPSINDVLGHSIYISELEQVYIKNNLSSQDQSEITKFALTLEISTSNLVSQMGLFSINTAIRLLGGQGALSSIDPRSSLAKVALSLGLLSELTGAISGGVFKSSILEMLKSQNASLSDEELNNQATELTASVELKILLLGVLNLAIALDAPKLGKQLLGSITDTGTQTSFADTLKSSDNVQILSSSLSDTTNLSAQDSLDIVNLAINAKNINEGTLQAILKDALIQKGVNQDTANVAAIKANEAFNLQISENFLQKTTITKESIKGTALDSEGINTLLDENNGTLSGIDLREKLALEFENSGKTNSDAKTLATNLISTLNPNTYRVSRDVFENDLKNLILNKVGHASGNLSEELTEILFKGDNSLSDIFTDRINTIKKTANIEIDQKLEDVFKKFITPDLITLGLAKILGDPATSLLYLASGIIYSEDESPSKPASLDREHLASIDIPI